VGYFLKWTQLIRLFKTIHGHSCSYLSADEANETNGIRTQTNKENNKHNNDKILIPNGI